MILIAIGANLPSPSGGSPFATCQEAVEAISSLPDLKFVALSSWYRSSPIPRSSQPDFCNGIVRLEGDILAAALLDALREIETRFGRVRTARETRDAARPLDLDIIDLNGSIRAIQPVILPHPRAHLRAFVLRPILDVAPGWRHPTLRRGVASLLADLAPQAIQPWQS